MKFLIFTFLLICNAFCAPSRINSNQIPPELIRHHGAPVRLSKRMIQNFFRNNLIPGLFFSSRENPPEDRSSILPDTQLEEEAASPDENVSIERNGGALPPSEADSSSERQEIYPSLEESHSINLEIPIHESDIDDSGKECTCCCEYSESKDKMISCDKNSDHIVCVDCVKTQVGRLSSVSKLMIDDGSLVCFALRLESDNCNGIIPYEKICTALDENTRTKINGIRTIRELRKSGLDLEYCRKCYYAEFDSSSSGEPLDKFHCLNCNESFCFICEEIQNNGQCSCNTNISYRDYIQKRVDAVVYRKCPECRISVVKTTGCNHMTHHECGAHFCYTCRKLLQDPSSHYCNHVLDPEKPCSFCTKCLIHKPYNQEEEIKWAANRAHQKWRESYPEDKDSKSVEIDPDFLIELTKTYL